jgi:hypothetical protein
VPWFDVDSLKVSPVIRCEDDNCNDDDYDDNDDNSIQFFISTPVTECVSQRKTFVQKRSVIDTEFCNAFSSARRETREKQKDQAVITLFYFSRRLR